MTLTESIKKAGSVLIVCHIKPDGDCLGAGFALLTLCEKLKIKADFVTDSEPPQSYGFLEGYGKLNSSISDNYDLGIAVDCADNTRLGKYETVFKKAKSNINIDHHPTNNRFAKNNYVEPQASSTCELLYSMLKTDGSVDKNIAYYLYLGIITDTGNFMHANTTAKTFLAAAELLEYGLSVSYYTNNLYKNNQYKKLKLISRAIDGMKFFKDERICIITISADMLKNCGCDISDTEGIIDYGIGLGKSEVAACLTQQAQNSYKVSFRSKGADVASAAQTFGGGGHKLAAGCVINGKYEDVIAKLLKALSDVMD